MTEKIESYEYSGCELDTFAQARNWKGYWSSLVKPYLRESVLEVGAGIGVNTQLLKEINNTRWVCMEPDKGLCERIKAKQQSGLLAGDISIKTCVMSQLLKNDLFDTILYIDVLEHIEDDKQELINAASHLNVGGHIVIVAPAHNFLFSAFDKKIGHFRRYDKKTLIDAMPDSLQIVDLRYLDCMGFFASLANKVLLKETDPKVAQVLFWDRLLVTISKRLDSLIRYRVGKTIFAVCKKVA